MSARLSTAGNERCLAREVRYARSAAARMKGLLGRELHPGEALVIEPARQVHTWGMAHAIDVIFCDRDGLVLHVAREMKPWRMTKWVRGARFAIELESGAASAVDVYDRIDASGLSEGSRPDR